MGSNLLVLGIGNILMDDDAAGVVVLNRLKEVYEENETFKLIDGGTLGLDLLNFISWADEVIIIDAVDIGEKAGTIVKVEGNDIDYILEHKLSPHQMGMKDILFAAELSGDKPDKIVLYGIQVHSVEMNMELSPDVADSIGRLFNIVKEEIAHNIHAKL